MEKPLDISPVCFRDFADEKRYKRLKRFIKRSKKRSSATAEGSLPISRSVREADEFLEGGKSSVENIEQRKFSSRREDFPSPSSTAVNYTSREPSSVTSTRKDHSSFRKLAVPAFGKRVETCFAHWTVMLDEQDQLIIEGNLMSGSYYRSRPVARRISAKKIETSDGCFSTLEGNITDENHDLPDYIREKFFAGFPDDWQNVLQVWVLFVRQGGLESFHWPTKLSDGDDEHGSEITDVTVENPWCSDMDSSCLDLDYALSIREDIETIYEMLRRLVRRLRSGPLSKVVGIDVGEKSGKATSVRKQDNFSPGKTRGSPATNGGNRLAKRSPLKNRATATDALRLPAARSVPEKENRLDASEFESEMYAGVRKIPVGTILAQERKFPHVRPTRRIRKVHTCPDHITKDQKENDEKEKVAMQKRYREEKANRLSGRQTSAIVGDKSSDRVPLCHIESRLNIESCTGKDININASSPVGHRGRSAQLSCQDASGLSRVANDSALKEKGLSIENVCPSPLKGKTNSRSIRRSSSSSSSSSSTSSSSGGTSSSPEPAGESFTAHTATLHNHSVKQPPDGNNFQRLESAEKSSQAYLQESRPKRIEAHQGISSGKANNSKGRSESGYSVSSHREHDAIVKMTEISESSYPLEERDGERQLLKSWVPRVVRKSPSDVDGNLVFDGHLMNRDGRLVKKHITTGFVQRRLSRSRIKTVDLQVYELVGNMVDSSNTVPGHLLDHCRDGCPLRIKDFCKAWIASPSDINAKRTLTTPDKSREAQAQALNVSVSSKGRRILPPLSYWTGERVVFKGNQSVYSPGTVGDSNNGQGDLTTVASEHHNQSSGRRGKSGKRTASTSKYSDEEEERPPSNEKRRKISSVSTSASALFKQPVKPQQGEPALPADQQQMAISPSKTSRRHQLNTRSDRKSLMGRRREEKFDYNFYSGCPSQEDALSDDLLSRV